MASLTVKVGSSRKFKFILTVSTEKNIFRKNYVLFCMNCLCVFVLTFNSLFQCVRTGTRPVVKIPLGEDMPNVRKVVEKPDKADAIKMHQSRFKLA